MGKVPIVEVQDRIRSGHVDDRYVHSDVTDRIIEVFYDVYNELGYGFLESVYEKAMFIALRAAGLSVERQVPTPVFFRGEVIADFRLDLLVNSHVLIELKAGASLDQAHVSQVLNYLRATIIEIGLLLNFGEKPTIRRLAFRNERKKISVNQR